MIIILLKYRYSYVIEDIVPSHIGPFDVGPFNIGCSNVVPFMIPPVLLHNESDNDDTDVEIAVQENSMHVAEGDENGTDCVDSAYANNEYVEIQDPYPDEFEGEDWVNMTVVENITAEHTRCAPGNATDDLKVADIFESKVKLLQA